MRTILFILRKEFLQIFRHRVMLPLIFLMPVTQLLILAYAADYEVNNLNLYLIDRDGSSASQQLVGKLQASPHFQLVGNALSNAYAYDAIQGGDADLFLEIPQGFQKHLLKKGKAELQVSIDAINGVKAGLANAYINAIIRDFNQAFRKQWMGKVMPINVQAVVEFEVRSINWFNPELNYQTFMVPGILVILITLIGTFLSGMNIVKEKEVGTIEQINVTPIRKYQFIIGKLLPFWIIALIEFSIGLVVAKLVFQIPFVGNLGLIFGFAALYLLVVLGIGLLVSTITETQQQAMFISWFLMMIFVLMSGLFTPIESMPYWAQQITRVNPVAYFVEVMRLVLLKGSTIVDIQKHVMVLSGYAIAVNTLAVLNYRKTN